MAEATFKKSVGFIYLGLAAGAFIVSSLIQGLGESTMFSMNYTSTGNVFLDFLIDVTFVPGWLATGVLTLLALGAFWTGE